VKQSRRNAGLSHL